MENPAPTEPEPIPVGGPTAPWTVPAPGPGATAWRSATPALRRASLAARVPALVVDGFVLLLLSAVTWVVWVALVVAPTYADASDATPAGGHVPLDAVVPRVAAGFLVLALVHLAYWTVTIGRSGHTFGMRSATLAVVRAKGGGLPIRRALLRAVPFVLPLVAGAVQVLATPPSSLGIDFDLTAGFGPITALVTLAAAAALVPGWVDGRGLHDIVAGSEVLSLAG